MDEKEFEEMTKEEMQRFLIKEAQRGSSEFEAYRNLMARGPRETGALSFCGGPARHDGAREKGAAAWRTRESAGARAGSRS